MGILTGPLAMPLGGGAVVGRVPSPVPNIDFIPTGTAADGMGVDISAIPDLDPSFELKSGRQVLAEALVRRLVTERGGLSYSPNYGTDVRNFLNRAFDSKSLTRMRAFMESEMKADERVKSVEVTLNFNQATQTIVCNIQVLAGDGPFLLVVAITALSVDLLRVS